jgi:hypothetical protein
MDKRHIRWENPNKFSFGTIVWGSRSSGAFWNDDTVRLPIVSAERDLIAKDATTRGNTRHTMTERKSIMIENDAGEKKGDRKKGILHCDNVVKGESVGLTLTKEKGGHDAIRNPWVASWTTCIRKLVWHYR